MPYLRGVEAKIGPSKITPAQESQTVLVAVGKAPVHQLEDPKVNEILKIEDYKKAVTKQTGFSKDFRSFCLSEAVEAALNLVGVKPLYVVNILDPQKHVKEEVIQTEIPFIKGKGLLADDKAILSTIELEDRTKGVDYEVSYDFEKDAYVFSLKEGLVAGGSQPAATRSNPVVAEYLTTAGVRFEDGKIVYEPTGVVPSELCHGDKAYIPIVFPKPEGAKFLDVLVKNTTSPNVIDHKGIDLENGNEEDDSVIDQEYVLYLAFADKDGSRLKASDYTIEFTWYMEDGSSVKTESVVKRLPAQDVRTGKLAVTYQQIDPDAVTVEDFIGEESDLGQRTGLHVLKSLEEKFGVQATDIIAPGFSSQPKAYKEMLNISPLNNHWLVFVHADIPVNEQVQTRGRAIEWKEANEYEAEGSKVYWPMGLCSDGNVYHLSTIGATVQMRTDLENGDIPFVSASNKDTPLIAQYFGKDSKNAGYDAYTANELTSQGITTCGYHAGRMTLLGTHTAAYQYDGDNDPRSDHDSQIRMIYHLVNGFQKRQMEKLDRPMDRDLKDSILIEEQMNLDALVSRGALYGQPVIVFDESLNDMESVLKGQFYFQLDNSPAIPAIYIGATVSYTDAGYFDLFRLMNGAE